MRRLMNKLHKIDVRRTLKQFGVMLALIAGVVGALASVIGSFYVSCVLFGDWITQLSIAWDMPVFYVVGLLLLRLLGGFLGLLVIVGIFRGFWMWADLVLCKIENKRKKKALQ